MAHYPVSVKTLIAAGLLLCCLLVFFAVRVRTQGWRKWLFAERSPAPRAQAWEWCAALGLAIMVTAVFCMKAFVNYQSHTIFTWDFGIYSHGFWNASQGNGFYNSPEGMDHLGSHASPVLYFLLPIYMVAPTALTLLLMNAVAIGSSIVPAWLLARRRLSARWALVAAAVFALAPSMSAMINEIHAVNFAVPLLLWTLWAADARRPVAWLVFLLLTLACKENAGMVAVFLGVYLWLDRDTRAAGVIAATLGLLWLVVAIGMVIPLHQGDHGHATMSRFVHFGSGWIDLLTAPVRTPTLFWSTLFSAASVSYVLVLLLAFSLVPLFGRRALLVPLPIVLQNVLSSHVPMRSFDFHYEALLLPGLFLAFVVGLHRILEVVPKRRGYILIIVLLLGTVASRQICRSSLVGNHGEDPDFISATDEVISELPPHLSLAAPRSVQPYACHRRYCVGLDYRSRGLWGDDLPDLLVLFRPIVETKSPMPDFSADLHTFEVIFENAYYTIHQSRSSLSRRSP